MSDARRNVSLTAIAAIALAGAGAIVPVAAATPHQAAGTSVACAAPYDAASPWNTPIAADATIDEGSRAYVARLARRRLTSDPTQFTYPVYTVDAQTPTVQLTVEGWFSDAGDDGRTLNNRRAPVVELPLPAGAAAAAGSDAQIIVVDPLSGLEWGAYRFRAAGDGSFLARNVYRYNTGWSGVPPRSDLGGVFANRGSGLPYLAGLVRRCEIEQGRIEHAIAFAISGTTPSYVFPATKSDGTSRDPETLPKGARLQLDPALGEAELAAQGCVGACLTLARAMQEYGLIVTDNSGRPKIQLEYEGTAGWNGLVDARTASAIPMRSLRVLELGPLHVATPAGQTPAATLTPGACTLQGTPDDDVLIGTPGPDVICGGAGDDLVVAGAGDDVLYGNAGDDRLLAGRGADQVAGGEGDDQLDGGGDDDQLAGDAGADRLRGGPGDDAHDAVDGEADTVVGGPGTDTATLDAGVDRARAVEG